MAESIQKDVPCEVVTPHLNKFDLIICDTPNAGRGVFASKNIARDIVVEVSPVLLFDPTEYRDHGKYTVLDSYTFVWEKREKGSTMALALGLGSLFNHSCNPNISYELDKSAHCIRYRTAREISAGDELCISYGPGTMWWEEASTQPQTPPATETDELNAFGNIDLNDNEDRATDDERDLNIVCPAAPVKTDAPLWRITASPDPATMPLETKLAWALNVKPQSCSKVAGILQTLIRGRRIQGGTQLRHLRTFRKAQEVTKLDEDSYPFSKASENDDLSVLITMQDAQPRSDLERILEDALSGLADIDLYLVRVPVCAAPSRARLMEWASVWPCIFLPPGAGLANANAIPGSDAARQATLVDRAMDAIKWSAPHATDWVQAAFLRCIATAQKARAKGEIGSAALVTIPPAEGESALPLALDAFDTRISESHPLHHSVPNAVRAVAQWRSDTKPTLNSSASANGQDYLLTGLSLFLTHEPCVYCAMALIHSRVKTVYFLFPSAHSGGFCGAHAGERGTAACLGGEDGGSYAIHEQSGLNHRYDVWRWVNPSDFQKQAKGLWNADMKLDL
ncbi:tRNA-specific adenosine deaminase subunit tad3 [Malassezia psittaci]|uniref:tRNA-specific adenosine deaminase subunit tad3 n=1 Tax=Malassezia psittaci TaxID=1821823 RepID=A0AAF0JKB8_9BASI|nr:tRNA-specific adenosine deaminase subunit tad3 [Malassezia psittaci]